MTNSRNKGANGEREVARLLEQHLGIKFERNLEQSRTAAHADLIPSDEGFPFIIEVKRHAKGWTCAPAWEAQVFRAAEGSSLHPCVAYRFDGQQWRFRVWFDALALGLGGHAVSNQSADLSIDGFAYVAREIMARQLE
jgi:Holliday junction resolvase